MVQASRDISPTDFITSQTIIMVSIFRHSKSFLFDWNARRTQIEHNYESNNNNSLHKIKAAALFQIYG